MSGSNNVSIIDNKIDILAKGLNRIASPESTDNMFKGSLSRISPENIQQAISEILSGLYYLTGFESEHSQNAEIVKLNERIEQIRAGNDQRIEQINSEHQNQITEIASENEALVAGIKKDHEALVAGLNKTNADLKKQLDTEQHGIGAKLITANVIVGSIVGGYNAYRYADGKDGISTNEKWITTGIGAVFGAIPILNILSISMTDKIVGSFVESETVRQGARKAVELSEKGTVKARELAEKGTVRARELAEATLNRQPQSGNET